MTTATWIASTGSGQRTQVWADRPGNETLRGVGMTATEVALSLQRSAQLEQGATAVGPLHVEGPQGPQPHPGGAGRRLR